MRPVNYSELKAAYKTFTINFILLLGFALLCISLLVATMEHDHAVLDHQLNSNRKRMADRREINRQIDIILLRFNQLSHYHEYNATELDNQSSMLQDVQQANFAARDIIRQQENSPSLLLYKKITNNVGEIASIQDSLLTSRFQIESAKSQLESCLKVNRAAESKLSNRLFQR